MVSVVVRGMVVSLGSVLFDSVGECTIVGLSYWAAGAVLLVAEIRLTARVYSGRAGVIVVDSASFCLGDSH